ncbi:MAG: transketolase family protein [Candidatus Ancaeobacter aquaticus]|nr:transketolase family protein [Candidatus Ancaeobacter aquaticus]
MTEKMKATRDGAGEGFMELANQRDDIVVLSADLATSTRADKFEKVHPDRFINMGICEQDMIGTAVGFAMAGKVPFACSFSCFMLTRAYDQIRVSLCYNNENVKLIGSHSGITVGPDGATAQYNEDIAIMRVLPNMKVIVPADTHEAKKAVLASADIAGPVYIRVGRGPIPAVTFESDPFEFGKAKILREGSDVSIIACGIMVKDALDAAEELKENGITARVINLHTIKPLDEAALINAAKKTGAIVTAEEHQIYGGMGSAVAELLSVQFSVPIEMIGIKNVFGESGTPDELKTKYDLTKETIVDACKKAIARKKK